MSRYGIEQIGVKPVIAGAVGAAVLSADSRIPNEFALSIMGKTASVPKAVLGFGFGLGSTFLIELINYLGTRYIPAGQRTKHFESFVVHVAGGALAFWAAPHVLTGFSGGAYGDGHAIALATDGIVTELASQYIFESFFSEARF